ncbi:iron-sulfur cluster assembly scaffold protein [Alphaproteobacteria bacterium LSUCC0719]|jgi:nitrogen fixation NifU-like protein
MDQLYQDRILAFAKAVRQAPQLDAITHHASVSNPTCGDRVDIKLHVTEGRIDAVSTSVRGCALCEAGAGLLLEMAPGLSAQALAALGDDLAVWLAGEDTDIPDDMTAFAPVRTIRNRHKCVTLAFEAGRAALGDDTAE